MANANCSASSTKWRNEGNGYYHAAKAKHIGPIVKGRKLQEAIKCYQRALDEAGNDFEAASSAAKNYAKTSYELLQICSDGDHEMKIFYYRECLEHYSKAVEFGEECKSLKWIQEMEVLYRNLYEEVMDACYEAVPTTRQRIIVLESFCCVIKRTDKMFLEFTSQIASFWLTQACAALNRKDFRASLNALREIYRPIEEVKRFGKHK